MGMWGSLASRLRLAPRFTDFFTDFEKKKTTVLQSTQDVTKIS